MDEYTVNAFVNRDDPVPVVNFEDDGDISNDNDNDVSTEEGGFGKKYDARSSLRMHLSKANMKDTLQKATGKSKDATHSVAQSGKSMQDRLLEKYASNSPKRLPMLTIKASSAGHSSRRHD
jgi:hypothetical protein